MKYNLSQIMKRAWEIKKEDHRNIFGLCLKMAWEEAKASSRLATLVGTEKQIAWAEDIRTEAIETIRERISTAQRRRDKAVENNDTEKAERHTNKINQLTSYLASVMQQSDAEKWIANRGTSAYSLIF